MHPAAIENLCRLIVRVAQLVEKSSIIEVDWYKDFFIASGSNAFVIRGECWEEYRQLVLHTMSLPRWANRFSEAFVQKGIKSALRTALDQNQPEDASINLQSFLEETDRFDTEQSVYVPIQSLQLKMAELIIGNVTFLPVSDELLAVILADTATTREYFFSRAPIFTVAKYQTCAEPDRAIERAEEAVRAAIEILVYGLSFLFRPGLLITLGIQNDAVYGIRIAIVRNLGPNKYSVKGSGVGEPVDLDNEKWQGMQPSGVQELSALLSMGANTEFDRALLRSLHWFALSHQQRHRTTRILALTTVLETMLTRQKGAGLIAATIAEGVAFVLGTRYADRKEIKKSVLELYGVRSNISHGSDTAVTLVDLQRLTLVTRDFLYQMVHARSQMQSRADLAAWIEQRRLS